MRRHSILLLIAACFVQLPGKAQLINPAINWFGEVSFFYENQVKKQQIKSIRISKSSKPDGRIIQAAIPYLIYQFYPNGQLKEVQKFIPLARGIDTASYFFIYDAQNRLIKRTEKQGPFQFHYHFIYNNTELEKEIKIDGNSSRLDTSYVRYYQTEIDQNKKLVTILNTAYKPFLRNSYLTDFEGRLIYSKTSYLRNTHFIQRKYIYEHKLLKSKTQTTYYGKKKEKSWEFNYQNKALDTAVNWEDDEKFLKYSITYMDKGLENAIIERNFRELLVNIYQFSYEYYD